MKDSYDWNTSLWLPKHLQVPAALRAACALSSFTMLLIPRENRDSKTTGDFYVQATQ